MLRDADRSHPGATAAVRNAKCLMQVQVANVRAHVAGATQTDQRVHVGAVHVNLSAVAMDDVADFLDVLLEHAVSGRVRDHQRGEALRMKLRLSRASPPMSMLPLASHCDGDDLESRHHGAGGIRAVSGDGDQANVAMRFAASLMVLANNEQPRVFAL